MNRTFTFFWRDGKRDVFPGLDQSEALNQAGYGRGAVAALDFWARGDCDDYDWNPKTHNWDKKDTPRAP